MAGRAARVEQRSLVDQDEVLPAQLGQVGDQAVADDSGTDDRDPGPSGTGYAFVTIGSLTTVHAESLRLPGKIRQHDQMDRTEAATQAGSHPECRP